MNTRMFRRSCAVPAAIAVSLAAAAPASAAKRMTAVRVDDAPAIDGVLDDSAWQRAEFVSDFAQLEPTEGAAPTRATDVAIIYDDRYLYVGARMHANGAGDVQSVMTRRDDSGAGERIIVSIDPFLDRRTAYSFAVTAAGVRVDWYHPDDNAFSRDPSYNPVWEARTHIGDDGWTAEMRIPFSQLRFPERDSHAWGINLNRYRPQDNEDVFWIVVPKNTVAWSSHFGELVGIEHIESTSRIEALPYIAGDATFDSVEGDSYAARFGADFKMGLGPSLTLDATINPDFGQVEADPAVVNLTAFETVFAEQRPFFVEGKQLLEGLGPAYFYSRRIGADARILGAAKVTGRLRGGTSLGALAAVQGRDPLDADPFQGFAVLRGQHEFGDDASIVGASFAATGRRFDDGDPLEAELTRQAYVGLADWRLRFRNGEYELRGYAGGTVVNGDAAAIRAVQESSAHYFQRPDQDHVSVDPDAKTLAGWTAGLTGEKRSGHWRFVIGPYLESPGFELNDTGILASADDISFLGGAQHLDERAGKSLRAWSVNLWTWEEWNFNGNRKPGGASVAGGVTLRNYWFANAFVEYITAGLDDDATRGGPLAGTEQGINGGVNIGNRQGGKLQLSGNLTYLHMPSADLGWVASASASWVPADRVKLEVAPRWRKLERRRQYIDTLPGGPAETFDLRYLFGRVELSEVAVQTRVQVTFTPDLSLEMYVEPFASSGNYTSFGILPAPRSTDLSPAAITSEDDAMVALSDAGGAFAIEQPDFTVLSLRGTAVLRWEPMLGSTLFLVWQQNRAEQRARGGNVSAGELTDAFGTPGANTIAVKFAYWWPVD
jgi:hypothetical protein